MFSAVARQTGIGKSVAVGDEPQRAIGANDGRAEGLVVELHGEWQVDSGCDVIAVIACVRRPRVDRVPGPC